MPEVSQKPDTRYGHLLVTQWMRVEDRASDKEREFLERLLKRWNEEAFSVVEGALMEAGQEFGFTWLVDPDNECRKYAEELREFYFCLSQGGWLAQLLGTLMHLHSKGMLTTPERVLGQVEESQREWSRRFDEVSEILVADPLAFADEIRAAVAKHPELAGGAK